MPAIALLVKESLSSLIKVVTTPRNKEYNEFLNIFVYTLMTSYLTPNDVETITEYLEGYPYNY